MPPSSSPPSAPPASAAFPYISLPAALVLMRVAVAIFFMAHAAVRVVNGTIPQFGAALEARGWPIGVLLVWCITSYELVGGTLMALGRWPRWMALGLFFIAGMGIVIIHARLGWFVGEHGTGGMEYSLSLMASLLVIAAADGDRARSAYAGAAGSTGSGMGAGG